MDLLVQDLKNPVENIEEINEYIKYYYKTYYDYLSIPNDKNICLCKITSHHIKKIYESYNKDLYTIFTNKISQQENKLLFYNTCIRDIDLYLLDIITLSDSNPEIISRIFNHILYNHQENVIENIKNMRIKNKDEIISEFEIKENLISVNKNYINFISIILKKIFLNINNINKIKYILHGMTFLDTYYTQDIFIDIQKDLEYLVIEDSKSTEYIKKAIIKNKEKLDLIKFINTISYSVWKNYTLMFINKALLKDPPLLSSFEILSNNVVVLYYKKDLLFIKYYDAYDITKNSKTLDLFKKIDPPFYSILELYHKEIFLQELIYNMIFDINNFCKTSEYKNTDLIKKFCTIYNICISNKNNVKSKCSILYTQLNLILNSLLLKLFVYYNDFVVNLNSVSPFIKFLSYLLIYIEDTSLFIKEFNYIILSFGFFDEITHYISLFPSKSSSFSSYSDKKIQSAVYSVCQDIVDNDDSIDIKNLPCIQIYKEYKSFFYFKLYTSDNYSPDFEPNIQNMLIPVGILKHDSLFIKSIFDEDISTFNIDESKIINNYPYTSCNYFHFLFDLAIENTDTIVDPRYKTFAQLKNEEDILINAKNKGLINDEKFKLYSIQDIHKIFNYNRYISLKLLLNKIYNTTISQFNSFKELSIPFDSDSPLYISKYISNCADSQVKDNSHLLDLLWEVDDDDDYDEDEEDEDEEDIKLKQTIRHNIPKTKTKKNKKDKKKKIKKIKEGIKKEEEIEEEEGGGAGIFDFDEEEEIFKYKPKSKSSPSLDKQNKIINALNVDFELIKHSFENKKRQITQKYPVHISDISSIDPSKHGRCPDYSSSQKMSIEIKKWDSDLIQNCLHDRLERSYKFDELTSFTNINIDKLLNLNLDKRSQFIDTHLLYKFDNLISAINSFKSSINEEYDNHILIIKLLKKELSSR